MARRGPTLEPKETIVGRHRRGVVTTLIFCCLASAAYARDGELRKSNGEIRDCYVVVLEDRVERRDARGAASALVEAHGAAIHTVLTSALKGFAEVMPEGPACRSNSRGTYMTQGIRDFFSRRSFTS